MRYLAKIILLVLLVSVAVSSAFSQDKDAQIYISPSTWQNAQPLAANDPVPPLGEGEEELIKDKLDTKTVKQLVESFVDRAESVYTEKYTAPEGFIDWLKNNPKLRATFWLALDPYYDDIGKAMEVLDELRRSDPKAVERFYHLAVAFAVVWDSPDAVQSSRYSCIWGMEPDQFESLPGLLDNFKHFTSARNLRLFGVSPDKLAWPVLVHVVDMDLAPKEIKWGIKKYPNKNKSINTLYDSITYDYGKYQGATPQIGTNKYNLQNLLKSGGICGDQAYFASRVAKLFGVPSMKVAGTGRTGGGHAWLGYMRILNNKVELNFTGRYFNDFYYTGEIFDPQTRTAILDRDVALLYEGVSLNYNKYINSVTLARMARGLMTDRPELALKLTTNALQQNAFCAPAWSILTELIEQGSLKPVRSITWFNQMTKSLKKYPDTIMACAIDFMGCIPRDDHRKRDANYQVLYRIFKTAKRPDLAMRLNLIHADELCARGHEDKALKLCLDNVHAHAKEGNLILPLLDKVMELSRKLDKIKETVTVYEKVIRRMPRYRNNQISKSYQDAAQLLVYLYNDVDMHDKANKLTKMAQLGEAIQVAGGIDDTHKKKPKKAIAVLAKAIKRNLKSASARNERGIAYAAKGEIEQALEDYNEAIRLNPKFAEAYINRADVYSNLGDYGKAIADYSEAIKINPKNAVVYNNRGWVYYNNYEFDKAMADYDEAIRLNPKYDKPHLNRGLVYHSRGEIDKAMDDYNEAIKLNQKDYRSYFNRGNIYSDKGEIDKALKDYNEAIRLNPKIDWAYYNRGNAYAKKGEADKALDDYNEAIRLNPKYDKAYYNRGNTYAKKGDVDKAMADYNEAIRLNPKYDVAYNNRGNAYYLKGELDKAIDDWGHFLELAPNHPTAPKTRENIKQLEKQLQEQNK